MASRKPLVALNGAAVELPAADTLATGLRIEKYTGTCDANGLATIAFSSAFKAPPLAFMIEGWSGAQMICGAVTSTTTSSCVVQGMVSRATLLLSAGPFTTAPSGTVVTVVAIGV